MCTGVTPCAPGLKFRESKGARPLALEDVLERAPPGVGTAETKPVGQSQHLLRTAVGAGGPRKSLGKLRARAGTPRSLPHFPAIVHLSGGGGGQGGASQLLLTPQSRTPRSCPPRPPPAEPSPSFPSEVPLFSLPPPVLGGGTSPCLCSCAMCGPPFFICWTTLTSLQAGVGAGWPPVCCLEESKLIRDGVR